MIDKKELKRVINGLRDGKIVEDHRWTTKDEITLEEAINFLNKYIDEGFLDYRIHDSEPIDSETSKKIIQYMLRNEIDDLENSDLCGAPWARVELRYLKSVYQNLDKWWKG